jgi:hypothetical protein
MNQQNADMFILNKSSFFPDSSMMEIRERLLSMDDGCLNNLLSAKFKNPTSGLLFSIGLGVYGADRFYVGHTFVGILKLILTIVFIISCFMIDISEDPHIFLVVLFFLTLIGVLIWYILDIFNISKEIKKYNYKLLLTILN